MEAERVYTSKERALLTLISTPNSSCDRIPIEECSTELSCKSNHVTQLSLQYALQTLMLADQLRMNCRLEAFFLRHPIHIDTHIHAHDVI